MTSMSCAKPSKPAAPKRAFRRAAVGLFRLSLLAAAVMALAPRGAAPTGAGREAILSTARTITPEAVSLGRENDGLHELLDAAGNSLGWAGSTFPQAASIHGYNGPSELLVVLDTAGKTRGVRLIRSEDTIGHVEKILADTEFWSQWNGRQDASLGDLGSPRVVSGATLTSEAMARGVAARFGASGLDQWFTRTVDPAMAARWFPKADRIEPGDHPGVSRVFTGKTPSGLILRSSRMGVGARGFNGVSDVIIALQEDKVLGVALLDSRDNSPYTDDVADELKFADPFAGRTTAEILTDTSPGTLVVSGASVTTEAVTQTVREMLRRHQAEPVRRGIPASWIVGSIWITLGVVLGLSKRSGGARTRTAFAILSVAAGLTLGWMVGQDQWIGWGRNGIQPSTGLPLLLLTAVALLVPALTGKNVYCSRICPHGAAQVLLGSMRKRRYALPPRLHHALRRLPWLTLIAIWVLALIGSDFPFAMLEPFEIWSAGFHALLPALILTIGWIAALFLPQAYCHYGCPTGAVFKFLSHSPADLTRRDALAAALVATAWIHHLAT